MPVSLGVVDFFVGGTSATREDFGVNNQGTPDNVFASVGDVTADAFQLFSGLNPDPEPIEPPTQPDRRPSGVGLIGLIALVGAALLVLMEVL